MSYLVFKRKEKRIYLLSKPYKKQDKNVTIYTNVIGKWPAHNETASSSNGIWPNGVYQYHVYNPHSEVNPESCDSTAYGCNGNRMFTVQGRTNMGIHSGRINGFSSRTGRAYKVENGLGMMVTLGCIRTTDQAMEMINKQFEFQDDRVTHVVVED